MKQITKDSTNISVELYIIDSTAGTPELGVLWNTAGIDLNYRRDGAVVTSITEKALSGPALTDAHDDGGFLEVGNGRYRLDVPDAAFATGVAQVTVGGTVTGMVVLPVTIQLVDFDTEDAVRMGLTSLPNAAADANNGLVTGDGAVTFTAGSGGRVAVDVEALQGQVQSAIDLKDFADTGYNRITHSVVLVDTTTTVTDTVSANAVSATATFFQDFFTVDSTEVSGGEVSGSVMLEVAKIAWDRVLSGANHNITNSAGRRIRQIQENLGYENGAVWIDTIDGTSGTEEFENGTVGNKVDNIEDAVDIATSALLNLKRFEVAALSDMTFTEDMSGFEFNGFDYDINFNGQNADSLIVQGASVSGTLTSSGAPGLLRCRLVTGVTLPSGGYQGCTLPGDITLSGVFYIFDNCLSAVAGTNAPSISLANAGSTAVNFRRYSGGIEIKSMKAGDTMTLEGDGQLIINADCTGGLVAIRGNFTVTDNASGAVTLSDDARFDVDQINAEVDTALADYDGPTNAEMVARTLLAAAYFDFTTDSVATDAASRTASKADVSGLATSTALATHDTKLDGLITTVGAAGAGLTAITLAADQSGVTIGNVTTVGSVTTKTGYAVSATGLDAVLYTSDFAKAMADAKLIRGVENVEDETEAYSEAEKILGASGNFVISTNQLTVRKPSDNSAIRAYTLATTEDVDPVTGSVKT